MWNRRYFLVAVFFFIVGAVFLQPRSQGFEYTKDLLNQYGRKRTSKFHLLVPASSPHVQLCRALVSSALLGYPPAVLSGWNGTGELDAAVTHLAKVRNVVRYFDSLPPTADDDLVLIIDGYDVIMQLPPDVLIRRYFAVTEAANAKLAARFSSNSSSGGRYFPPAVDINRPHQSILFGPDKLCWPVDFRRPACYAVPETGIPDGAFGQSVGEYEGEDSDISHNQPQWLNSGTIMGPVSSMRHMFDATMERINATYDPDYICRDSDQMYMSDVWGEQEYARSVRELKLLQGASNADGEAEPVPQGIDGFLPESAEPEKWRPVFAPGQKTEFEIGLDYGSSLFQAWAGYENFLDLLSYNTTDGSALVDRNVNDAPDFAPFSIHLPADVTSSIARLLAAVSDVRNSTLSLSLGTNLVTRNVYSLFHCTGEKGYLDELWGQLWFFPYAKALLKATVSSVRAGASISESVIDGRIWKPANVYPALFPSAPVRESVGETVGETAGDTAGETVDEDDGEISYGAWADLTNEWLSWEELCAEHEDVLFSTERVTEVAEVAEAPEAVEAPEALEAAEYAEAAEATEATEVIEAAEAIEVVEEVAEDVKEDAAEDLKKELSGELKEKVAEELREKVADAVA